MDTHKAGRNITLILSWNISRVKLYSPDGTGFNGSTSRNMS
jgi:hypothetical protein